MSSFENKVVIVTGCSSGIGLATTRILLDRGARVFGIDISPFSQGAGGKEAFTFHQVDLTKSDAANEAVAVCLREYGPKIDVLANVAGIMDAFGSVDTVKESEWERVLSINLTVPVRLMAAVLPSMQEHKGGAIVNVASRAALSGAVAGVAYTASKHGLVGATKNVAWRFHNDGIRCNAVLPGGGYLVVWNPEGRLTGMQALQRTYNPPFKGRIGICQRTWLPRTYIYTPKHDHGLTDTGALLDYTHPVMHKVSHRLTLRRRMLPMRLSSWHRMRRRRSMACLCRWTMPGPRFNDSPHGKA
jgi:NAD(P)-dependent dehydrogenase (short-subunit alcohol dehydrogenase family)